MVQISENADSVLADFNHILGKYWLFKSHLYGGCFVKKNTRTYYAGTYSI